ncbi:survival motor neuron protein isoform X2 [Cephus cinctus]|uniref:Survival motor neuron protein isoform X2 n=1 Tax=Cephus cinctus TaxID=211228 RepID=A0AAJ7FKK3_CEPCN|nr:survival motor neuron protein isoform X2 [Cephus cinctus]
MAEEDNVLFVRDSNKGTSTEVDDVWDDSALIKAYDKAVNLAKQEVDKRMGIENQDSHGKSKKSQTHKQPKQAHKTIKKWSVGSPCRAVYSEDGEIYEAVISKIYENTGTCIVKFIGYGNFEKVELAALLESEGLQSQIAQQKDASLEQVNQGGFNKGEFTIPSSSKKTNGDPTEKMECDAEDFKQFKNVFPQASSFSSGLGMMPPAPPLPPQLMSRMPDNDGDALSSMLMSWYLSGFHTGKSMGLESGRSR